MTLLTDAPSTTGGTWRSLFGLSRQPGYQARPRITLRDFHITAAATAETGARWHAVLIVEGVRTTDHREIANGALGWRDLPLPLMFLPETSWGHDGARICGRIEQIDRINNQMVGSGSFDVGEDGAEAERLVTSQTLRWVSADLEVTESTLIEIGINLDDLLYDDGWLSQLAQDGYDWWERIDAGQIMGATIVPFPAFPQAVIALESEALPETSPDNGLPTLTSSAAYVDGLPPAEWFEDPQLERPTKFRVEDSGRIFGHVAAWDTDHIGLPPGQKPPRSRNAYAYFRMGTVKAMGPDGPAEVATGPISVGGGHANERLGWRGAVEHYDSTSSALADVACGEDNHGIWVAGALRPDVDSSKVRAARASRGLSGDWRWIGGNFELVAALVVNVPGFPIPDALAASAEPAVILPFERPRMGIVGDQPVSLVAAGMVREDPVGAALRAFGRKLAEHQAVIDTLRPLAAETLLARTRGKKSA